MGECQFSYDRGCAGVNGNIVEDDCWLRQNECLHVNLAEVDAVLRGVNPPVTWKMERQLLMTNSKTVFYWTRCLEDLKTKADRRMLICPRLQTINSIICEYGLQLDVKFVTLTENKAGALTTVPNKWLSSTGIQSVCVWGCFCRVRR